ISVQFQPETVSSFDQNTQTCGSNEFDGFVKLAIAAERAGKIRREQLNEMRRFAELRNLMVHDWQVNEPAVEPSERLVERLERLYASFTNPPKVFPEFKMVVGTCTPDDEIRIPISLMRDGSYSQVPVLNEGKVIDLLTAETVTRWLASEIPNQLIDLPSIKVRDVLKHRVGKEGFRLISRSFTLLDVANLFESQKTLGQEIDALIITESGKDGQNILGLVTVYDMPSILKLLGVE
ncbi:CBS domain-containing protein, partial [uncultured Limnobacter sp.]|uniref:CBS domain-containing protein n=2 Tax=Limnobacter TaxID=131079 RepID=UPI0025F3C7C0